MIEASRIAPRLYQGSRPPVGQAVARGGFDCVVLCAMEYQPPPGSFDGAQAIYCPMDDAHLDRITIDTAGTAARRVAERVRAGQRVLVTCQQGRNRSGLVMALSLYFLTGKSGASIVRQIKKRRHNALTNLEFARFVEALPPSR